MLAAMRFYSDPERPANELLIPYIELAGRMGWDPYIVRRELRELDRRVVPGFKTSVMVEFKDLSFHVHAPGNLNDEEIDEVRREREVLKKCVRERGKLVELCVRERGLVRIRCRYRKLIEPLDVQREIEMKEIIQCPDLLSL